MRFPSLRRALPVVVLGALFLASVSYAFRGPILIETGRWFVVDDPPVPGDFIYLLGGDVHTRPFYAAHLYSRGLAPKIVIPKEESRPAEAIGLMPNGTDVSVRILRRLGVPDSSIIVLSVPGGVGSTQDEAEVLRAYVSRHPASQVLVVTSMFHTRRARWTIRRVLGESRVSIWMMAAPDERFDHTNWWQHEDGLLRYNEEVVKFIHSVLLR